MSSPHKNLHCVHSTLGWRMLYLTPRLLCLQPLPLFLSCEWLFGRHRPSAPFVSFVLPVIRTPSPWQNELGSCFDGYTFPLVNVLVDTLELGGGLWPNTVTGVLPTQLRCWHWHSWHTCDAFRSDPRAHFSNYLVRLDKQSVALILTVTVLLFQSCGIIILTCSRLALRRIKPHIYFCPDFVASSYLRRGLSLATKHRLCRIQACSIVCNTTDLPLH